jgi:anaerobic dimethyl sulfoxide reductase subunit B
MALQLAFYFEQEHCVGCKTCQIACKDKNNLAVGQLFRKVTENAGGDYQEKDGVIIPHIFAFWISISCNHCLHPICVKNCPTGALWKRPDDGIVVLNPEQCIGCKHCIKSCPYKAPQYNPTTGKVGKCNFCLDQLAAGKVPVCVAACPLRALSYGPLEVLQHRYGTMAQTIGMPGADITWPALVITPHRQAIIKEGE